MVQRASTAVLVLIMGLLIAQPARAEVSSSLRQAAAAARQGRQVKLRDQLRVGLKVSSKTKGDLKFIDKVVDLVEKGKLSRRLVETTFLWARKRAKSRSGRRQLRPIVYFRPVLTLRAKRLGVII
jgi:hypothetical protein